MRSSILKRKLSFIFLLISLFLCLHSGLSPAQEKKPLRVHFISVGYGDAILVEAPDSSTMLIDAGDAAHATALVEYLKMVNVSQIDTSLITHPHKNHFEGFFEVLKTIPIKRVFVNGDTQAEEGYLELIKLFDQNEIPVATVRKDSKINLLPEDVKITILHPSDLMRGPNDNALVTLLEFGKTSFLLTADVGEEVQSELLTRIANPTEIDCVQIPHHGGPVASTFIDAFPKAIFVVSTGPNAWGLPGEENLQKLKGRTLLRTDTNGTIVFESTGSRPVKYRLEK